MTKGGLHYVLTLLMVVTACTSQPDIHDDSVSSPAPAGSRPMTKLANPSTAGFSHEKLAASFMEEGRFADALLQWKILSTLHPGDARYETRIRQTEEQINTLASQRQRAGIAAFNKGDSTTARHELLAALALAPARVDIIDYLRHIEYERVWQIQFAKLEKLRIEERKTSNTGEQERSYFELGTLMFREGDYSGAVREIQKYLNSYPGDAQAKKLISDSYAKLAAQQRQQGQLQNALANVEQAKRFNADNASVNRKAEQELRNALAEEYYDKGLRALRGDLKLAIWSFGKTLEYNPQHAKARAKLADAQRMQKRLEEISK